MEHIQEQLLSLLMNPQASAAASSQAGLSGASGSFNKTSTAGVNDMLQSLYKQMRESRHSGEAAAFGGWAFAGHGARRGAHAGHVLPGRGLEGAMAPYYDPVSQAHQEALYHQAQAGGAGVGPRGGNNFAGVAGDPQEGAGGQW